MTDIDPLEALFNAPAAGETESQHEAGREPNLTIMMVIEGTPYEAAYILPLGFPWRYQNEMGMVESVASTLGEVTRLAFIQHWRDKGAE